MKGKSILLGVCGSIAAYKAAELARLLIKEEAAVQVVMTASAQQFITPMTFQVLSGQPVYTDMFDLGLESRIGHIEAARGADLVMIAPATANVMAKMAAGIADDILTTILLATTAPVMVCPAMNCKMYEHPVTQRNLRTLRSLGYHVVEPAEGFLACKEEGKGRLPDLAVIFEAAHRLLTAPSLRGRRILVSAGPTREPFDPVRFISNPSSGKMGYALAQVAARRAAEVHLVTGPSPLSPPAGVRTVQVATALEMRDAVCALAPRMDAIVMAAAVSDYRPSDQAPQKVKKTSGDQHVVLVRNPDILATLGQSKPPHQVLVGFAAETEHLLENATEKLIRKNLDFIVANNLTQSGCGFGTDTNEVKIIDRSGNVSDIPCMAKEDVAARILDRIERLLGG